MKRATRLLVCALGLGLATRAHAARTVHPTKLHAPPASRAGKPAAPRFPGVSLFGAHVGEALLFRPRDEKGRVRREAGRALEHLLRCRQNGARHRLHPRLGEALYEIGRHYAGHRIEIFSGYRPRAFCDRAHSRHMSGSAIDFHVEGVTNEALIAYLRKTFHPSGVGFYPHGVHVHLDVERDADTYWVDAGPPPPDADPVIAAPPPELDHAEVPPRDTAPEGAEPEAAAVDAPAAELGEPPVGDPELTAGPDDADL